MAGQLVERATIAPDLSQVPEALRGAAGKEAALQLKEVLDRLLLPPVDSVPNARMVTDARRGAVGPFLRGTGPLGLRVPNTEIEIVEITEGERQGQFLFSAGTIERIEGFYQEVREGVKRIIQANPTTRKDYFHVVLNDFGPDGLVVMLYFFVKVPDWSTELVERQRVFLEIIRLAAALHVEFAFPTQTLEIETFPGRPGREPTAAASDQERRRVTEELADAAASARPRGLGIFVPPQEEHRSKA